MSNVEILPMMVLRRAAGTAIAKAQRGKTIIIMRNSEQCAAIIGMSEYARLKNLEQEYGRQNNEVTAGTKRGEQGA